MWDNGELKGWGNYGRWGGGSFMATTPPATPVDLGTGRTAIDMVIGESSTCVLLDNGRVKCFGDGGFQLGGAITSGTVGDAPGEMGDLLLPVDLGY